jgi:hypothetical protein
MAASCALLFAIATDELFNGLNSNGEIAVGLYVEGPVLLYIREFPHRSRQSSYHTQFILTWSLKTLELQICTSSNWILTIIYVQELEPVRQRFTKIGCRVTLKHEQLPSEVPVQIVINYPKICFRTTARCRTLISHFPTQRINQYAQLHRSKERAGKEENGGETALQNMVIMIVRRYSLRVCRSR